LGSGILKILLPPQLLHNEVFNLVWFFGNSFKPHLSFLLRSASLNNTSIVNNASSSIGAVFARIRLSDARGALISSIERVLPQGLSTILFKVTWFITIETFEDFPLSSWQIGPLHLSFLVAVPSQLIVFCLSQTSSSW
jgi:hypothetical protein